MLKIKQKSKKFFISAIVFLAVSTLIGVLKTNAANVPITGWIWGGSEEGAEGVINGNETGVGWISMSNTTGGGTTAYGMNVPDATCVGSACDLSGYAWSENVGWISFQETGPFPTVAAGDDYPYSPRVDVASGEIRGWARIMSMPQAGANAGGWTGWIRLHSDSHSPAPYGVKIDYTVGKISGYAWSEELGAIKFNGTNGSGEPIGAQVPAPVTTLTVSNPPAQNSFELATLSPTQTVELTLNATNATSCDITSPLTTGGSWNQAGINTFPTIKTGIDVDAGMNKTFTATCTGFLGLTDSDTQTIMTTCQPKECSSSKCVSGSAIPATSPADCIAASTCSSDGDCESRSIGGWKEVNP